MASTTGDGALQVLFKKYKLTLYLTKKGRRVLGVTFHDTTSWCHGITWICTLIPDEYSPYINVKLLQQLSALKEKFATHGRLTSIQIDRRMFVFRHETEDKAIEMLGSYTLIKVIIFKFLRETGAQVKYIKMKSEVDEAAASIDQETLPRGTTDQDVLFSSKHEDDVDAPHSHPQQRHDDIPHAQEDEEASHLSTGSYTYTGASGNSKTEKSILGGEINTNAIYQDNRTVNNTIIINPPSGKAVCESWWKAKHENIPQWTDIDNETVKILLKEVFLSALKSVWWGCMVFCFEHESMEDAIGMIVQHADIKEDILHFLQELDPSIDDIVMEVEVRELSESEEQTAETSGSGSHSSVYSSGSHSSVYGSGSHSSVYSSGSHSSVYGSGSHSSVYGSGPHSSGYTSSDPSLKPLVKGQDSDRRASSDPIQDHSQSEEDPLLSTASHATLSQADFDLCFASGLGRLEEVKRLLTTPGVDIDCRMGLGSQTPVMEAAHWGHRDVVELLVSEGADVSLVNEDGDNILHLACAGGDVESVKYVLSLNVVDIDARNNSGKTAAGVARDWGRQPVLDLLVSRGAQWRETGDIRDCWNC